MVKSLALFLVKCTQTRIVQIIEFGQRHAAVVAWTLRGLHLTKFLLLHARSGDSSRWPLCLADLCQRGVGLV
jgi:hypothetical protein